MSQMSKPESNEYLTHVPSVTASDSAGLIEAQKQYGNSWKQRGGVGAFMMLARKWDRIERRLEKTPNSNGVLVGADEGEQVFQFGDRFDIFHHLCSDDRGEGLIDDIRDLRRYLVLIEAEAQAMGLPCATSIHRDNKGESDDNGNARGRG